MNTTLTDSQVEDLATFLAAELHLDRNPVADLIAEWSVHPSRNQPAGETP